MLNTKMFEQVIWICSESVGSNGNSDGSEDTSTNDSTIHMLLGSLKKVSM
jgi:hypothetical protein